MIVSKLTFSQQFVCWNRLLQRLVQNEPSKAGFWFFINRVFISSSNSLSRSTPSLAQLNLGLSSSTNPSLITDEYWPNLLFTDDTWAEVDESGDERLNRLPNSAWDLPGTEEIPAQSFSSLKLLFTPKSRSKLVKIISEELDLNYHQADRYYNFLRIKPISRELNAIRFIQTRRALLRLLKDHLERREIVQAFELFTLPLNVAQYRISFFKECGFESLRPYYLLNFEKIKSLSEATIKHMRLLDVNVSIVDSLLSQLPDLTEEESSQLREDLMTQGLTIGEQYEKILSFSRKRAEKLNEIWRKNRQHLRYISLNGINILSNALKNYSLTESYSSSDMRSIFEVDPYNLSEIITQIPKHFDENTLINLLKYPKILQTYSSTLLGNLHLLKRDFGFDNAEIDMHADCLLVETSDLRERITYLHSMFGRLNQSSRSVLSLLHLDKSEISSLCKEMKDNGFPVSDVSSLYEYHSMTKKKVKNLLEIPAHLRGLNRELGVPQSIIAQTLHQHPNFRLTNNHKIKRTFDYIKNLDGITSEQLLNGLNLCLYDIEKIDEALNLMKERNDFGEWQKHPFFLEALIYTIEKIYSFDDVLISDDQEATVTEIEDDLGS